MVGSVASLNPAGSIEDGRGRCRRPPRLAFDSSFSNRLMVAVADLEAAAASPASLSSEARPVESRPPFDEVRALSSESLPCVADFPPPRRSTLPPLLLLPVAFNPPRITDDLCPPNKRPLEAPAERLRLWLRDCERDADVVACPPTVLLRPLTPPRCGRRSFDVRRSSSRDSSLLCRCVAVGGGRRV